MQDQARTIPEEFDIKELEAHLTEAEIEALKEAPADDAVTTAAQVTGQAQPAAETTQATAPVVQQQPVKIEIPDTSSAEKAVKDADSELAAIEDKIAKLLDAYDEGEMTRAEYQAQQIELSKQQANIIGQKAAAQQLISNAEAIAGQVAKSNTEIWYDTLDNWGKANPDAAAVLNSPKMLPEWDQALRSVNSTAVYRDLPHEARIALAYDFLRSSVKATTGQMLPELKAQAAAPKAEAKREGPREDDRPDAIQTLGGLNAADDRMVSDGQFAAIDRKMMEDPLAAERMLEELQARDPGRYQAYMDQVSR